MDDYDIFSHQSILDTFKKMKRVDELKDLYKNYCYAIYKPEMDEKMTELCHFDFVIYDKEFHIPYVIIEVNSRRHLTDPAKAHIDLFKQFVTTHIFGRPFIKLDLSITRSDDEIFYLLKDIFFMKGLTILIVVLSFVTNVVEGCFIAKTAKTRFFTIVHHALIRKIKMLPKAEIKFHKY